MILASASEARARLLRAAGVAVTTKPARLDEAAITEALVAEAAKAPEAAVTLATMKAEKIAGAEPGPALVIGCDQLLEAEGRWLDKPADRRALADQLLSLRGRSHRLVSAAVVFRDVVRVWHQAAIVTLHVRPFSDAWLEAYLEAISDDLLACVGGYQIEGLGAQLFSRIDGDIFAVQGLPLLPLLECLRNQGALRP
ncbi:MAG: Maf family protein [Geminicoccaceae bacterium]